MLSGMFVVTEADAAAIRAALEQRGELSAIVNRSAFPAAAVDGLTACEAEPDSKAAKEMRALWRVVEKELKTDGKAVPAKRAGAEGTGIRGGSANRAEAGQGA
jgi:hypothetical protein